MQTAISAQHSTTVLDQSTISPSTKLDDIVRIVRDPRTPPGKCFHADESKSSEVRVSVGFVVQRAVPIEETMVSGRQHHNKGGIQ